MRIGVARCPIDRLRQLHGIFCDILQVEVVGNARLCGFFQK